MGIFKIYQTKSDMFELNIPLCQQSESYLVVAFILYINVDKITRAEL